jgi:hypothetical protein
MAALTSPTSTHPLTHSSTHSPTQTHTYPSQAKAYAHEMVRVGASRRWVSCFCLKSLVVVDAFTLLMTMSEMLPLSWQMDWWSAAAGELTAVGYCEALKVLANSQLARARNPQIILAMQVGCQPLTVV